MLKKIVFSLQEQKDEILKEVMNLVEERIVSYQTATVYDRSNIENTIIATLTVIFKMLNQETIDENAFNDILTDMGERRARQEIPLDDVVGLFKIVREVLLKCLEKMTSNKEKITANTLLSFNSVLNQLFDRIDMGLVKQYIKIKDNIIQVQQSFLKHKLNSLFKLVETISNNLNIKEFCGHLLEYLNQFYDVRLSGIFLLAKKEEELYPETITGLSKKLQHEKRLSIKPDVIKKVIDEGVTVIKRDRPYHKDDITVPLNKNQQLDNENYPEWLSMYAPLTGRQRTYGLISIHNAVKDKYEQLEIQQFETLARIVTVAIENARFYQNLIEEKGKLDAIVNSVNDGLILIDFHEEIVFINEQAAKYFQLPAYKLIGVTASIIPERLLKQAKDPYTVQSVYLRALSTIMDHPVINFTLFKPDLIDVKLTMFPVRDREHHFIGRGILIENISHENEINRMKSEFVALASHTMRTPMTSILGFASLLMEEKNTEKIRKKYINNIHKEAQRLTYALNDMLDLANIEAGKIALKLNPVNTNMVIERTLKLIKADYTKEIEIKNTIKKMPMILADQEKVEKALYNLLANAMKYSENKIVLTVKKTQVLRFRNGWMHSHFDDRLEDVLPAIQISVEDDGPGIALDQLDAIFEPFYRLPVEQRYIQEGSGLGLTIAKYSIEAHGGRLWVETKVGKGSIFTFILPIELIGSGNSIAGYDR